MDLAEAKVACSRELGRGGQGDRGVPQLQRDRYKESDNTAMPRPRETSSRIQHERAWVAAVGQVSASGGSVGAAGSGT